MHPSEVGKFWQIHWVFTVILCSAHRGWEPYGEQSAGTTLSTPKAHSLGTGAGAETQHPSGAWPNRLVSSPNTEECLLQPFFEVSFSASEGLQVECAQLRSVMQLFIGLQKR